MMRQYPKQDLDGSQRIFNYTSTVNNWTTKLMDNRVYSICLVKEETRPRRPSRLEGSSSPTRHYKDCAIFDACPTYYNLSNDTERNNNTSSKSHQDEGYVTPDEDQIVNYKLLSNYPWEYLLSKKYAYTWECYGITLEYKNCPFIFLKQHSSNQLWKVVQSYGVTPYLPTVTLKCVSLEQLGIALKNLLTGVESNIFQYSKKERGFLIQDGFHLSGSTESILKSYCQPFIQSANYFHYISEMLNNVNGKSDGIPSVYQVLKKNIQSYLHCYSGIIQEMLSVQHFLQTCNWVHTLQNHLYFLFSILQAGNASRKGTLIALLYDEVSLINNTEVSYILNYILQSCCDVYFSILKKWIFEGECIDIHKEFFIEAANVSKTYYNHKFWTHAFVLNRLLVPGFLKGFESDILVCGKSMALLKLCNQNDLLCLGMKQGYPNLVCCLNKSQLAKLKEDCLNYKTRINSLSYHNNDDLAPGHDYNSYSSLRNQSLCRIKVIQEEERIRIAKKKHCEMLMLKRDKEERMILKEQNDEALREQEINNLKQSQISNQITDLRINEERELLVNLYSDKSEVVNNKIKKTEWKISRAMLHEKRIRFIKESSPIFETRKRNLTEFNNIMDVIGTPPTTDGNVHDYSPSHIKLCSCVMISEHCDCPIKGEKCSKIHCENDRWLEPTLMQAVDGYNAIKPSDDTKRQWILASDVAEEARQSALKYKEKNIHSNLNIFFGEVIPLKDKFIKKPLSPLSNNETSFNSSMLEINSNNQANDENSKSSTFSDEPANPTSNLDKTNFSEPPSAYFINSVTQSPKMKNESKILSNLKNCYLKHNLYTNDIDMTNIYQNLQLSVKIPLLTQLELINKAILRLLFVENNMMQHLKCIRQYFFLFDGIFSKMLATNIFPTIQTVQKPSHLLNVSVLNSILRLSIGSKFNDEYTERLSFSINEIPEVFIATDPEVLDCISMQYKTYWPLNIIISDGFIKNCDKVFRFILQIQRASWVLEQDICILKSRRSLDYQQYRQIHLFCHTMSHFVNAIKQYVFTIALEESWKEYETHLQKAKTLDDVYGNGVACIKLILSRCLLTKKCKSLHNGFIDLLRIVLKFHEALRCGDWIEDNGLYKHSNIKGVTMFFEQFLSFSKQLFVKISDIACCSHQLYLKHLLLLLSSNDFYIK